MTEPSQYFKGRTVQEQMNEVIGYVDTRAAEVATAAIASDVAQVHQDMLDADADASAAAASAAAAAGTLANAVKKTGEASQSIAGDIAVAGDLTGGTVTVPTPVNNTDAASKKYVDDHHDATKIDITAINTYAVGLTGNQITGNNGPIAGIKEFSEPLKLNGVNNLAVIGDASSDTSQWLCLYKTTPITGTFYWNALAMVTKRRQGFSGANNMGFLEMIVTPSTQYVVWLICGTGLQLADFKVIRNAANEVKVCVTNTSGINNQVIASIIGHHSGTWIPDNTIITDAAELSLLSTAPASTVVTLR